MVLVGMLRNLKVDPYKLPILQGKRDIFIYQFATIFGQVFSKITQLFQDFLKFEPILAQIWENFEKSTHSYTTCCILQRIIRIPRG